MLLLWRQRLCIAALALGPLQPEEGGDDPQPLLPATDVHLVGLQQRVANYWGGALACWSGWDIYFRHVLCLRPWILVASSAIDGDDLVTVHASFAYRARSAVVLHLKPAIEAGPTIQVPAQGDYGL